MTQAESDVVEPSFETIQAQPALGERGKIDLFRPSLPTPDGGWPVVVLVHGGGWARGDRTSFHWVAQHMVNHGLAAISCSYRVAQEAPFPACYDDLVNLLRWLRHNASSLGLVSEHCALLGSSAGGHLVSLLMTRCQHDPAAADIQPIRAGVVYCPPLDLQTQHDHDASRGSTITRDLLGGSPAEQPRRAHDATIFNWIHKPGFKPVPLWIAHGDMDMVVPIDDTYELVDLWQQHGGEATFHVEKGAGHTMVHPGTGPRQLLQQDQVIAFLKKHLQA